MAFPKPIDGSKLPLDTKGDLIVFGKKNERLPVGTNGQVLTADSAQALGVKWTDAPSAANGYPAYNPDAPPSSPNAMDDEFNGDTLDEKWDWANQGTATATVGDIPSLLTLTGVADSNPRCLVQPVPEGDWTAITKVHFGNNFWADSWAGLVVLPATNGTVEALIIGKDGTDSPTRLRAEKWNNWTSWGASHRLVDYGPTTAYLRFDWDSANNKARYFVSSDGMAWTGLLDWSTISLTPGRVGLMTRGSNLPCYFEFFRVIT